MKETVGDRIDILAVVQARMSSSRLPGKVLKPILGKPMLFRQIERIKRSRLINKIIVATSVEGSDDLIESMCLENQIDCFRGDLKDVLDRFYQVALKYDPRHIVRLTADCPLIDPRVIDETILFYKKGAYDYASNTIPHTFPDGLDVEIFNATVLAKVWSEAKTQYEREHVTPFFYNNPSMFRLGSFRSEKDLSSLRWTVDKEEDFKFVERVYEALYPKKPDFSMADILEISR